MSAALELHRLGHAYLGRTVLDRVDLRVDASELVALVGPSGCGKSTLLQLACGLIEPLRGHVVRRYARHAVIFQEPRLLPWESARANIAFPLRVAGCSRSERDARVADAARRVALDERDLDKYPVELSGGMRQRTAIARALVVEPDLVFLDEPFTALDAALKRRMQDLVVAASAQARFGALFVTHDLLEAVRIAHRIVVLDVDGRGVAGERAVPGDPGARDDAAVFATAQHFMHDDPLFRQVHDLDERRVA